MCACKIPHRGVRKIQDPVPQILRHKDSVGSGVENPFNKVVFRPYAYSRAETGAVVYVKHSIIVVQVQVFVKTGIRQYGVLLGAHWTVGGRGASGACS